MSMLRHKYRRPEKLWKSLKTNEIESLEAI